MSIQLVNASFAAGPESSGIAKPRVLVVDDDLSILKAIKRLLVRMDLEVLLSSSPIEALAILREKEVAVVISDQMMPNMSGTELLTLIRQNWPATVAIMITACGDIRVAEHVVNRKLANFFVSKPWDNDVFRSLIGDALNLYARNSQDPQGEYQLETSMRSYVREQACKAAFSLARAVDARDRYTHGHSQQVAAFAQVVGKGLGLDQDQLEELRIGGLLHDVGKIGIPDEGLLKPGKLTDADARTIRLHPIIGGSIVEPIDFPWTIPTIERQHHENHDGSGYPLGILGKEMALPARIVRVVDAYEAMSANRVYRTARTQKMILEEFENCRGTQFDPEVTDVFIDLFKAGKIPTSPS